MALNSESPPHELKRSVNDSEFKSYVKGKAAL